MSVRPLAIATAVLFLFSSAFPVAAGLSRDTSSFPPWWGVVDVVLAAVLAVLAMALSGAAPVKVDDEVKEATYRVYRVLLHGILILLVVFFALGNRITWTNCLTGFAWRSWLLLYTLPAWIGAMRTRPSGPRLTG